MGNALASGGQLGQGSISGGLTALLGML
jgi:hypothetical protein